jgi:hypothetical protein
MVRAKLKFFIFCHYWLENFKESTKFLLINLFFCFEVSLLHSSNYKYIRAWQMDYTSPSNSKHVRNTHHFFVLHALLIDCHNLME